MVKGVFGIILIMSLFFGGCSREQERQEQADAVPEAQSADMKTIVAVGDSLTAGFGVDESDSYPVLLEKKLQTAGYNYRVINAGVSAETSSGTLSRLEWIMTLKPDIVLLETGANDGLRGIEPQLIEDNIRQILTRLNQSDVVVLVAGMKMVWNLGPLYVEQFNSIYPRLAAEFDAVFMEFFLEGVAMDGSLNLSDGVHPNKQGYAVISDNIYPYVIEAIQRFERR